MAGKERKRIGRPCNPETIQLILSLEDKVEYTVSDMVYRVAKRGTTKAERLRNSLNQRVRYHLQHKGGKPDGYKGRWAAYRGLTMKETLDPVEIRQFRKRPLSNRAIFWLLAATITSTLGTWFVNKGKSAYDILQTQGFKAATNYMVQHGDDSEYSRYLTAYIYNRTDPDKAEAKVNELLEVVKDERNRGLCHYLKSIIELNRESFDMAEEYLDLAEEIFDKVKDYEGIGNIYYVRSLMSDRLREYEASREQIEISIKYYDLYGEPSNLLTAKQFKVWNLIRQEKYISALASAKESMNLADPTNKWSYANSLSRLAFVHGLNQDFDSCINLAFQALEIITEMGDDRLYVHNCINFLLVGRCTEGFSTDSIEVTIRAFIEEGKNAHDLESLVEMVNNYSCGI